eukprot:SAG22_NODE_521_length_9507_cov_62.835991_6_plen_134_part_00
MNDTKSFLETSTTAMAITSMVRGVRGGVLPKAEYDPVIKRAWKGLLGTILPNGTVTQVCCGTGIQPSVQAYYDRVRAASAAPRCSYCVSSGPRYRAANCFSFFSHDFARVHSRQATPARGPAEPGRCYTRQSI